LRVNEKTVDIYNASTRYVVVRGGAGSGKSVGVAHSEIRKAFESKHRTLWVRKVAATIRNSVYQNILDVLNNSGFSDGVQFSHNKTEMSFAFSGGSSFISAGLDDENKLKSIAGITRIVIEEADQITFEDFMQLDLRLRGIHLVNPQIVLIFNPTSIHSWIKKRFFDKEDPQATIIESTYLDNAFLDESYKNVLKNLAAHDENYHRVYVLNQWGIPDYNKLFAKDFRNTMVEPVEFSQYLDFFLTFDLNYDPACLVCQNQDNKIVVIEEFHEVGMNLPDVLIRVTEKYQSHGIIIINGDVSGDHSRNISDNTTSYQIIQQKLSLSWEQFHVPKTNPSHVSSRILCNSLFRRGMVKIHPRCKKLIADLESAEIDDRGSLDPWKKDNPKLSHLLDAFRYHVNAEYYDAITT
jgi:phage terminase large subunit